ncbi:MAG: hypothetical protein ACFFBP_02985 [Promethearchaeota archaeon]
MPIIPNWEVSSDSVERFEKMMATYPVGDPIITSKVRLDNEYGYFVAGENGISWRIKFNPMRSGYISAGKSKWVRWHDIFNFVEKKPGVLIVELKLRKKGQLVTDKHGNIKMKKWKFVLQPHKNEPKGDYEQRKSVFGNLMKQLLEERRIDVEPPTSDSVM